jgi:hypothetical protein
MAWIESHQTLRDHPKLARLARLLDVHRTSAAGLLHFLWWWALDHAEDGDLTDFDALDLALAAGWEGDPDTFVKALEDCGPGQRDGFIANVDGRRVLHDWHDYAGKLVDRRVKDRERKKAQREKSDDGPPDVQRTSDGTPAVQNRTVQNLTSSSSRTRSDKATRLPDGWTPQPEPDLEKQVGGPRVVARELAKFRDHWAAAGGQRGRKVDWQATWRNWLRNTSDRGRPPPGEAKRAGGPVFGSDEWKRQQAEQRRRAEQAAGVAS